MTWNKVGIWLSVTNAGLSIITHQYSESLAWALLAFTNYRLSQHEDK